MSHHTGKELGVCKCPTPDCKDATRRPLRFAPGVLVGHKVGLLGTTAQRRALARAFKEGMFWLAVIGVSAVSAGYLVGRLM